MLTQLPISKNKDLEVNTNKPDPFIIHDWENRKIMSCSPEELLSLMQFFEKDGEQIKRELAALGYE